MESYEIWITLLRRNPEKEPEILTMASVNKMSELLFFRSGIQAVIKEKFTPYQCCKTIYDYLVNGYEIQQLSPKCCATVWNHISSRDLSAGDSWTEGVRLFLSYCRQHDITQDYLINKVTGYVENAIYYLDDERLSNNKVHSIPAIPEKLEPGFGFKDGCVPVKSPEWKVKQTVAFLGECHALLYAKEGTDFEISCLMSKQSHEEKADFTAVFGIESMAMVIQSGLQSKEISMINSEILSRNILQDLNDGFHMEYMATSMHAQMWLHLSWMGDREKQYYKAGIQTYADYCVEHDITNRLIDAYMNWDFQIPDFLQEWQSMKEKCASQVSMRQDRKR